MKRIAIIFAAILALAACNNNTPTTASANFEAGKHYQQVSDEATDETEVRLYFSYNCIYCSEFDPSYSQMQQVLESSETGIAVERTHVDFVGYNGADMTWARSMGKILEVEGQVSPLIFSAIHDDKRRLTRDDVRDIFLSVGVEAQAFDAAAQSAVVQALQAQQRQQVMDAGIRGVPVVLVNGQYQINRSAVSSPDQLAELVKFLAGLE